MTLLDPPKPDEDHTARPVSAAGSPGFEHETARPRRSRWSGPSGRSGAPESERRPRRRWRTLRIAAIVIAVAMLPVAYSYSTYLTRPGDEPVSVRSVDFLRDHGFDSTINNIEQWWYTRHKPTGSAPPKADIPQALRHTTDPVAVKGAPPVVDRAVTASVNPAPLEAVWTSTDGLASKPGAVQQTFLHPDAAAPSVIANVVRFDQSKVRAVYVPGLSEPGGNWAWGSQIPRDQRSTLIAAFNAGFKFKDTAGGVYTEGRNAVRPLQVGIASLVIGKDGKADVEAWPGDSALNGVASVRQNLSLIVDGARPVDGLTSDAGAKWGTKRSQFQYTWRASVGVDAQGRLVYAAGSQMTMMQLANAMVDAGAVRAMELDIHDGVVTFNWYRQAPTSPLGVAGMKLTPSMQRKADRYLAPDQRDFFAIQAR